MDKVILSAIQTDTGEFKISCVIEFEPGFEGFGKESHDIKISSIPFYLDELKKEMEGNKYKVI